MSKKAKALLAGALTGLCAGGWLFASTALLLGQTDRGVIAFAVLFALACALGAALLFSGYRMVFYAGLAGLFCGLLSLTAAFEADSIGSYGILRLFAFLAGWLAAGAVAEIVYRAVKRKRDKARQDALLAKILYKR